MYKKNIRKIYPISFTKEGLDKIKKDYETLLRTRPDAVKTLSDARNLGDLSENGLYKSARSRLSGIDANLRRLKNIIKFAVVRTSSNNGIIGIGSTVEIFDGKDNKTFRIVGTYESNPKTNSISVKSPIGHALVGKKVGDHTVVRTPKGPISYKILSVQV
ncbi:MAG: transcription elongation factor GreA [Candidatus Levybacteria bacterium CG_4_10_14_0_2_um_filter_36_16]|nr:MAG: hypothetical protein AUK12_05360 [Candidatus Levybacteria bacterium CG2_30_37_29]PIR79026.1 MAG: transcription elongation factor GreA [Candidatus Levybacteria bacterium CG10_big_fil_rev_8_21_14_0_10_36_30]PIZ97161.1 MAG: transcription elongation factor GreA [Candidatus Levybacteria bacterium CG_4_10_14_0_2_um_filter_36_16]PJA90017.1 MAG: transcription elongation factor GreA [Candidatus Levybacteria bacterium CG_4_9_14_3_um_filter_36_7]